MWSDDSEMCFVFLCKSDLLMFSMSSYVSRTSSLQPRVNKDTMIYGLFLVQPHQLSQCLVGIGVQTTLITVMCELYCMDDGCVADKLVCVGSLL